MTSTILNNIQPPAAAIDRERRLAQLPPLRFDDETVWIEAESQSNHDGGQPTKADTIRGLALAVQRALNTKPYMRGTSWANRVADRPEAEFVVRDLYNYADEISTQQERDKEIRLPPSSSVEGWHECRLALMAADRTRPFWGELKLGNQLRDGRMSLMYWHHNTERQIVEDCLWAAAHCRRHLIETRRNEWQMVALKAVIAALDACALRFDANDGRFYCGPTFSKEEMLERLKAEAAKAVVLAKNLGVEIQ